ncbi:MAG: hypothetical protein ACEQSB_00160 [Undibacterium sp.]
MNRDYDNLFPAHREAIRQEKLAESRWVKAHAEVQEGIRQDIKKREARRALMNRFNRDQAQAKAQAIAELPALFAIFAFLLAGIYFASGFIAYMR